MTAYWSRMGRAALEDGPDEPRLTRCPTCHGVGWPADGDDPCETCLGQGEIEVEEP